MKLYPGTQNQKSSGRSGYDFFFFEDFNAKNQNVSGKSANLYVLRTSGNFKISGETLFSFSFSDFFVKI